MKGGLSFFLCLHSFLPFSSLFSLFLSVPEETDEEKRFTFDSFSIFFSNLNQAEILMSVISHI